MFEVVQIYHDVSVKGGIFSRWKKSTTTVVVLRAIAGMSTQYIDRTFQGHGHYSAQTYQVDIAEGDRISLQMPGTVLRQGDRRALETLVANGYLREYGRMVATTG